MPSKIRPDHPLLLNPYLTHESTIHYVRKVASRFHNTYAWNIPLEDQFQVAYCALLECYPKSSLITIPEKRLSYCLLTMLGRLKSARYPSNQARQNRSVRELCITDYHALCKGSESSDLSNRWLEVIAGSDPSDSPLDTFLAQEKTDLILNHLDELTTAQAEVIYYQLIHGLSQREIAKARHVSPQSISDLSHKAPKTLHKLFHKKGLLS